MVGSGSALSLRWHRSIPLYRLLVGREIDVHVLWAARRAQGSFLKVQPPVGGQRHVHTALSTISKSILPRYRNSGTASLNRGALW